MGRSVLTKQRLYAGALKLLKAHPVFLWVLVFVGAPLGILAAVAFCGYLFGTVLFFLLSL